MNFETRNLGGAKSDRRVSQGVLALLAPRHPRVLRNQVHAPNTGGLAISWLGALKNLSAETTQEKDIGTDAPSSAELSESLTQQGDKSDKKGEEGLLSLLAPPHIRNSENHVLRQGCREKDISTQGRPWLEALGSLEERALKEEKRNTNTVVSSVEEILESPVQRGAKSARSPTPSPDVRDPLGRFRSGSHDGK